MAEALKKLAEEIFAISKGYGLEASGLGEALEAGRNFQLPAAFLGPFGGGKSALLNALLGAPLLPEGIAATPVPTWISFGEAGGRVLRGGVRQPVGLGELRGGMDLEGVTELRVRCGLPFLREIPALELLDTPGLGDRTLGEERAMLERLPRECACFLVFSADEPVVRESEAALLPGLRSRGIPVTAVLTKCDKLTGEGAAEAADFLGEALAGPLGREGVPVLRVSARGDVEPVHRALLALQARAEELSRRRLARALVAAAARLRDHLLMRGEAARLGAPEFRRRMELLETRERLVAEPLEAEARRLEAGTEDWVRAMGRRLVRTAQEAFPALEAILLSGENPAPYLDDALQAVAADGFVRELEPLLRGYLKSAGALLRLQEQPRAGAPSGLEEPLPARALPGFFPTSSPLFERVLAAAGALPRGRRREAVGRALGEEVFPVLAGELEGYADRAGREALESAMAAIRRRLEARRGGRQAVAAELLAREEPDEARRKALLDRVERELAKAEEALNASWGEEENERDV